MPHSNALFIVNSLQEQLRGLVRSSIHAMQDGKVGTWEAWALGLKGINTATSIIALLQEMDEATKKDILYVLEHGEWVLPEEGGL